jgi:hypothetical protein
MTPKPGEVYLVDLGTGAVKAYFISEKYWA